MRRLKLALRLTAVMLLVSSTGSVFGQANHHHPLSQHTPPGIAAGWLNGLRGYDPAWIQPLQITVEGGGVVEVFAGNSAPMAVAQTPALVGVNVGHLYRLRLSELPQLPDEDIYPTIELLDRLHPPAGREAEFPIPIVITQADIRVALSGQLVTRVIYLEQPQLAQTLDPLHRELPQSVPPNENALKEADRLGRPMAIIRIGGRKPSVNSQAGFFGNGGSVQLIHTPSHEAPATVRLNGRSGIRPVAHNPAR